ncbi:hypothetical protein MRX96_031242 [Rhipicephalus microplus]
MTGPVPSVTESEPLLPIVFAVLTDVIITLRSRTSRNDDELSRRRPPLDGVGVRRPLLAPSAQTPCVVVASFCVTLLKYVYATYEKHGSLTHITQALRHYSAALSQSCDIGWWTSRAHLLGFSPEAVQTSQVHLRYGDLTSATAGRSHKGQIPRLQSTVAIKPREDRNSWVRKAIPRVYSIVNSAA